MDSNDNIPQPEHTSPAPSQSGSSAETRPAPAEPDTAASTTPTEPLPPQTEGDAANPEQSQQRSEHEAHFLNLLSFLMPMIPPPPGATGPAQDQRETATTAENGPVNLESNGPQPAAPDINPVSGGPRPPGQGPPRDSVFIFLNFGPSNPATSSNPAKAKEMIDSLPAVNEHTLKRVDAVVRAESGEDDGWNCGICLESDGAVKALPCNHLFHSACLEPWFATHLTCPTCRMQLDPLNTLSNHERPTRTRTMRPTASGSNTPSARNTPYPARSPLATPQPEREMMTTTIIFGGPFHSSPAPLGPEPLGGEQSARPANEEANEEAPAAVDSGSTATSTAAASGMTETTNTTDSAAQPETAATSSDPPAQAVPPAAPLDSPMQTDTPPVNGMPRFMFFGNPGMAGTPPAGAGTDGEPHQPRFIFFGDPPGGDQPHTRFPFPPQPQGTNAPAGAPAAAEGHTEGPMPIPNLFGPPPADGQPRFQFNFHRPPAPEPAAPPRKTITLDQWLHGRERMLGWRCDGPICGVAPSEDDPESDGKPTSSEKTVPIYSSNQPYFTPPPPDAPPRPEDFTILACSHRWHRSCLEIAARSDGYWRVEGERVWVRCMACRHEGWIHAGVDEMQSDTFEADTAAVENCT